MKATGDFGTRWTTDVMNNIARDGCIPVERRKSTLVYVYNGFVEGILSREEVR